jgi:hypothetical protein
VPSFTKDDWTARIEPHLTTSLQTVSEKLTQSEPVQTWLRGASTKAAEGLGQQRGIQAGMQGYARMMDDLEETFPDLVAAVSAATAGCGTVDLEWRSQQPTLSRVYIAFDRDFDIDLFARLDECTPEAAREALATVVDGLPEGEPYPNRPNTVTGLVARAGTGVGVRMKEYLQSDRGRRRTITLLPPGTAPVENLSDAEAGRRLLGLLCPDGPER